MHTAGAITYAQYESQLKAQQKASYSQTASQQAGSSQPGVEWG